MSNYEARILALERLLARLAQQMDALAKRMAAVEQQMFQNWTSQSWTPAGGGAVGYATTPAGGIPAGGAATCTGGTLPGGTGTIQNKFATAIGGNKTITYGIETDGTTLLCLSEDCP